MTAWSTEFDTFLTASFDVLSIGSGRPAIARKEKATTSDFSAPGC